MKKNKFFQANEGTVLSFNFFLFTNYIYYILNITFSIAEKKKNIIPN